MLTIDFLKRYYLIGPAADREEYIYVERTQRVFLNEVADRALGRLKKTYNEDPVVHHTEVRGNDFESQLWWMEGRRLPQINPEPVGGIDEDEFGAVLQRCEPIEPYQKRLRGDRRNFQDVNHNPVKPQLAIELYDSLLRTVRRQIQRRVLRDALFDRYKESFNRRGYRPEFRASARPEISTTEVREKDKVDHYCELLRVSFDSWCIESERPQDGYDMDELAATFGANIVEETPLRMDPDREFVKEKVISFLLYQAKPNLQENDFEILCKCARDLFESE